MDIGDDHLRLPQSRPYFSSREPMAVAELKRQGIIVLTIEQEVKGFLQKEIYIG